MVQPSTPSHAVRPHRLPAPGTYRLDPARSSTTFITRHLFGLGKVTGSLAVQDGQVTITADTATSTVEATLLADSFQSASAGRDKVAKSPGYLDAAGHPHLTFVGTSLVPQARVGWCAARSPPAACPPPSS